MSAAKQVQAELEEVRRTHHLPYEELNRVVKERDRLAEENDELRRYRASVDVEQIEREKAELLNRYELEKKEIRAYMMKQDHQLAQALHACDCQREYIAQLQGYIANTRLPEGRLLQIKNKVVVREDDLRREASTFNWDQMFHDIEQVYTEEVSRGGPSMQPPPAMPEVVPVQWDKDEFLARLQRHFSENVNVGKSTADTTPPQTSLPLEATEAPPAEDEGSARGATEEDPGVDFDGRPLPPGWTNEEHVSFPLPFVILPAFCRLDFLLWVLTCEEWQEGQRLYVDHKNRRFSYVHPLDLPRRDEGIGPIINSQPGKAHVPESSLD